MTTTMPLSTNGKTFAANKVFARQSRPADASSDSSVTRQSAQAETPLGTAKKPFFSLKKRGKVQGKAQRKSEDKLRYVSREFSGFFINQILQSMRKTIHKTSIGNGGSAEKQFQALADDEYSKEIGQSDFYGLTDLIYNSLKQKSGHGASPVATASASAKVTVNAPKPEAAAAIEQAVALRKANDASRASAYRTTLTPGATATGTY